MKKTKFGYSSRTPKKKVPKKRKIMQKIPEKNKATQKIHKQSAKKITSKMSRKMVRKRDNPINFVIVTIYKSYAGTIIILTLKSFFLQKAKKPLPTRKSTRARKPTLGGKR